METCFFCLFDLAFVLDLLLFFFFSSRIITDTAVYSENSVLLAKTPEVTSKMWPKQALGKFLGEPILYCENHVCSHSRTQDFKLQQLLYIRCIIKQDSSVYSQLQVLFNITMIIHLFNANLKLSFYITFHIRFFWPLGGSKNKL